MKNYLYYKAINWNEIEDELDNAVWERATALFWLDTRIPIVDDKPRWEQLSEPEKNQLNKILISLVNLSTYQSLESDKVVRYNKHSQQENAIFNNIQFTEMVNTKAYNTILSTFNQNQEVINKLFDWVDNYSIMTHRLTVIDDIYRSQNAIQKRFIFLCVEGIMKYGHLAYLIDLCVNKGFTSIGMVLEMIIANESLHCLYVSHKLKLLLNEASEEEKESFKEWAVNKIQEVVQTETEILSDIYTEEFSKRLSLNLIFQEVNHIMFNFDLQPIFKVEDSLLTRINSFLDRMREHNLTLQTTKHQIVMDAMLDEDYDF